MDAISALLTRASAARLIEPAPSPKDLETIFASAARAPDHGRLRPTRLLTIEGTAREKLGRAMAERLIASNPQAGEAAIAREAKKPLRAPYLIAVISVVDTDHPKIPEIEQVLSTGAAAQNIMLAAHALGYGCLWKTGGICYDDGIKALLGIQSGDHIVGFMYLGTIDPEIQDIEFDRPDGNSLVSEWR